VLQCCLVLLLPAAHVLLVVADEDSVVDVEGMESASEAKVGGGGDAVEWGEGGAGVNCVHVSVLCDKDRMRPTHWKSGAAGVDKFCARQLQLGGRERREGEVGLHPLRQKESVIEVVDVDLGDEEGARGVGDDVSEEVGGGKCNWRRVDEEGVGGACVDDETQPVVVLRHREDTVHDDHLRAEAHHAKREQPLDERDVLGPGGAEGRRADA